MRKLQVLICSSAVLSCALFAEAKPQPISDIALQGIFAGGECEKPVALTDTCIYCEAVQPGISYVRCSTDQDEFACAGYQGPLRPVCDTDTPDCGGVKYSYESGADCIDGVDSTYLGECERSYSFAYEISAQATQDCTD